MQGRGRRADPSTPEAAVIGPLHHAECNRYCTQSTRKNPSFENFPCYYIAISSVSPLAAVHDEIGTEVEVSEYEYSIIT